MSSLGVAAAIGAAAIGGWLLYVFNRPAAVFAVNTVEKLRWFFGILFMGLVAYHLIQSGDPLFTFIAALGFMFLTLYALIERPWSNVI